MAEAPGQPSLRRMRRFGVRPDRELGQNFLIDSNILGVIGRAAELGPEDVVLEIGGGLGVLSEYLAERVGHVHVVEVDERLREALGDATDPHANVSVHWGDAMRDRPRAASIPRPEGRREPALRDRRGRAAAHDRGASRRRALGGDGPARGGRAPGGGVPGSGAYGTPSVIAQLACEVRVLRAIPRTVFHPAPNVDSVLVRMRRREPRAPGDVEGPPPALRALVAGAFAHRRKTLAGSLRSPAARRGARASRCGRRSRSSATRRTCAPSASRRRTSARSPACSEL